MTCTTKPQPAGSRAAVFEFRPFLLSDRPVIQSYIHRYAPVSCEYNFANLYAWQHAYQMAWTVYRDRLLIYDGLSNQVFMPLGEVLLPEALAALSLDLLKAGIKPDIGLVDRAYLDKYPDVSAFYRIEEARDAAEYIYEVQSLCDLKGAKLQKKKNLISQFARKYPDFTVSPVTAENAGRVLDFADGLLRKKENPSKELFRELEAIELSLLHMDQLGLAGLILFVGDRIAAFSMFSPLSSGVYDIQFEKADTAFKGAAQAINQQTAQHLRDKCRFLNREQDLGIKGLRQAKLSYTPAQLLIPCTLVFSPGN